MTKSVFISDWAVMASVGSSPDTAVAGPVGADSGAGPLSR